MRLPLFRQGKIPDVNLLHTHISPYASIPYIIYTASCVYYLVIKTWRSYRSGLLYIYVQSARWLYITIEMHRSSSSSVSMPQHSDASEIVTSDSFLTVINRSLLVYDQGAKKLAETKQMDYYLSPSPTTSFIRICRWSKKLHFQYSASLR